jgi:hypothetical protein
MELQVVRRIDCPNGTLLCPAANSLNRLLMPVSLYTNARESKKIISYFYTLTVYFFAKITRERQSSTKKNGKYEPDGRNQQKKKKNPIQLSY